MNLPTSGRVNIQLTATEGSVPLFSKCIVILDSYGNEIVNAEYGEGTYGSDFDLIAGDYTLRCVYGGNGAYRGKVTFIPTFTPSQETVSETSTTMNNDVGSATKYTSGTVIGQLALNDEVDIYKFTVADKGTVKISLISNIAESTKLEITNTNGTFLKEEFEIKPGNHTYIYKDVPKGTYYISFVRTGWSDTGTYKFSISAPGAVTPKKISLKKPVNQAGRKMVVKWTANTQMSCYEIQIAQNKKFSSGVKKIPVSSAKTSSEAIKKLKKGITYYVRIRSYVKVSGKKKYSAWSDVKGVKIKK